MAPAQPDWSQDFRRVQPAARAVTARPREGAVPIQQILGNSATASMLSVAPTAGPAPAVRRGTDWHYLQRSSAQAKEMQQRAWQARGIQGIRSMLGFRGELNFLMGVDTLKEPIRAHHIPGQIADVAMVIAGVHGSEQSGVEVADLLLAQLRVHQPFFTVVIVPRLFPDNVASRAAWEAKLAADQGKVTLKKYRELRKKDRDDKGRDPGRVTKGKGDPNRQFPELGKDLDLDKPVDSNGEPVEPGNLALMALITAFSPDRLISIHAIKNLRRAGVFSDPQPHVAPGPLAAETDRLAIETAKRAKALGARVAGNKRGKGFTSLYPGQDPKTAKKQMEEENKKGQSLGQWGPSKGIGVFTVEIAEQYTSTGAVKDSGRKAELEAHATALREVLLGPPAVPASGRPAGPAAPAQAPADAGASSPPVQRLMLTSLAGEAADYVVSAHGNPERVMQGNVARSPVRPLPSARNEADQGSVPHIMTVSRLQQLAGNAAVAGLMASKSSEFGAAGAKSSLPPTISAETPEEKVLRERASLKSFIESCPLTSDNHVLPGGATFDIWFRPPILWINVKLGFKFVDGNVADYPDADPRELAWDDSSKTGYKEKWLRVAKEIWHPGIFTFYCHRPYWESLHAKVVPDFTAVDDDSHYEASVVKIPTDVHVPSKVSVSNRTATFHSNDAAPGGKQIRLPGGKIWTPAPGKGPQRPAAHEAGHLFGLGDEYVNTDNGHQRDETKKIKHLGIAEVPVKNDDSIMSKGERVKEVHSVAFRLALQDVTGIAEWSLRPKFAPVDQDGASGSWA